MMLKCSTEGLGSHRKSGKSIRFEALYIYEHCFTAVAYKPSRYVLGVPR
jgi:hypothetical protein